MSHGPDDAALDDVPDPRAEDPSLPPLLAMALRRLAQGTGTSDAFRATRTALLPVPDLVPLLADIPGAVIGGIALRAYMPERATDDLNVLVRAASAARAALERAGYQVVAPHARGGWRLAHADTSLPVDVSATDVPWLSDALRRPARDLIELPIVPWPELLVLKLPAGRPQDDADGVRVLRDTPAQRVQCC